MKNPALSKFRLIGLCVTGFLLTQLYQNCGQMGQFEAMDMSSLNSELSGTTDRDHPDPKPVVLPTQKMQLVNRQYVASLLREVFTNSDGAPGPALEHFIHTWVMTRAPQYGLACNPYDSYTGNDCGGDISAANLPSNYEDNTVRESFKIQVCENLLAHDGNVEILMAKIKNRSAAPTADAIRQVYGLFYRGDPPEETIVNSLIEFDRALAAKQEPAIERWRGLALQVCESPGWQLK